MRTSILLLLLHCTFRMDAQISFLPLDENPGMFPLNTFVSSEGNLLTIHTKSLIGFRNARLHIKQWNGLFWTQYPVFQSEQFAVSEENRLAVCLHKNSVYAAGSFLNADSSLAGVIRWDGTQWISPGGGLYSDYVIHKEISIHDMQSFGNLLFVCGRFNRAAGKSVHNFVYLEQDTWKNIPTNYGQINDLQISGDTLFVAGSFSTIDNKPCLNLAAFYNGQWHGMYAPVSDEIVGLGQYKGQLILITRKSVYSGNTSNWNPVFQLETEYFGNACVSGQKLYLAGTFKTTSGIQAHLLCWDGNTVQTLISEADVMPQKKLQYFVNQRGNELLFGGNLLQLFQRPVNHIVQLWPGKIMLEGKVYHDINQNCLFDGGDKALPNTLLSLNKGEHYTSTDASGNYSFVLKPGQTSEIEIFTDPMLESKCMLSGILIPTGNKDSSIQLDFGLHDKPLPPLPELQCFSKDGFRARHGYQSHYTLQYKDVLKRYPVQLKLFYPEGLKDFQSNVESKGNQGSFIEWSLNNDTEIKFSFRVDHLAFQTGDPLNFRAESKTGNQADPTIIQTLDQEVVSAFDPNDKQCSDQEIAEDARELDYHIRFQNLGNDSAVDIHVIDTISPTLPMQFIKSTAYSHPQQHIMQFKVRDHAIVWTFKNIMLPPQSLAGNENSSGFIQFNAGLQTGLKIGDSILNRAHIYFDFQAPVHTNTVSTRVTEAASKPQVNNGMFHVFPNPGKGIFEVQISPYLMQEVEVFTLNGQRLHRENVYPYASHVKVNPGALIPGIYIIRITHSLGVFSAKLIVSED